ncbi:TlpA family protein disulfide reductase [Parabacteroides sp. OttesenSCG-928-K15]|nr:TlpA family protein disulfide reductase [Parabacteroides sp. OttesenSCG-928-K15]
MGRIPILISLCLSVFLCNTFAQDKPAKEYFGPEMVVIGEDMPDTFLEDTLKQKHRLRDLLDGERYMLVEFWDRYCSPCMKSLPELRALHEEYNDKLIVVSISLDDYRLNFKSLTRKNNITWHSLWDVEGFKGLFARYGQGGVPTFVLVTPEGKVEKVTAGYDVRGSTTCLRMTLLKDLLDYKDPKTATLSPHK